MPMRNTLKGFCIVIVVALMLSGCAKTPSIYRGYRVGSGDGTKSVLIDAKQRAIISTPNPYPKPDSDKGENRMVFVCAEPSPDALSAISAVFSGGAVVTQAEKEIQLQVARALQETAGQLGRRNATIQLLRDGLYRQCEAYMNGLINWDDYKWTSNRYINAMVVLLAIEQITPSPPAEGNTGNGEEPDGEVTARIGLDIPETDPAEPPGETPADEAGDASAETPDDDADDDPADTEATAVTAESSASKPVVRTAVQGWKGEVSEEVAAIVYDMTHEFLRNDTVAYCLRLLEKSQVGEAAQDVCQWIALAEYAGGPEALLGVVDSFDLGSSDPLQSGAPDLTPEQRQHIINPQTQGE